MPQSHPIMTLMPRALSPALSPVGNTQQTLDWPRAGSVGEQCYLLCMLRKYSLLLCPCLSMAHKRECESVYTPSLQDRWTWAGHTPITEPRFPICKLGFRGATFLCHTGGSARKASRRWRPGQSPGWTLCRPAGDLCGPQEQWLRDRGNRHPGPADPSQLALSREDHGLPRRGKLRPTLVPQLLLLGVARICPALTGGLAWDEENILGHLEFK